VTSGFLVIIISRCSCKFPGCFNARFVQPSVAHVLCCPCTTQWRMVVTAIGAICWGTQGTCLPHFFRWGVYNMLCPPTFSGGGDIICHVPPLFLFRFCIWRRSKNKSDVCYGLCQVLFMSDIAKLMLKQSLVWYHWILLVHQFSFNKMIFSIFQVSKDRKRWLTASVRHVTLRSMLLEFLT